MAAFLRQSTQLPHLIDRGSPRKRFRHRFQRALPTSLCHSTAFCFFQYFVGRLKPGHHLSQDRIDPFRLNALCQPLFHFIGQGFDGQASFTSLVYLFQQRIDVFGRMALGSTQSIDFLSILKRERLGPC
jgi:hypothetical protein